MRCAVCFRHCLLEEGQTGFCRVRRNEKGKNVCGNYGRITSLALDPIEKKPLKRFYPGSRILSAGSYGCNLRCPFCQNWTISQRDLWEESAYVSPRDLVDQALQLQGRGNIGIAMTYNEPSLSWEYLRDVFKLAKKSGLKTVAVTNGSVTVPILDEFLPYTDAMNIDLKGFTEDYYHWLHGDLETVKDFIRESAAHCHVELTMLVVPGKNDNPADMERMCRWIAQIDPEIPLHLSRYFPRWKWEEAPTPLSTLERCREIAGKHLRYVYLGNV